MRLLESKGVAEGNFRRMKGSEVDFEWLNNDECAMQEPIVIETPEGPRDENASSRIHSSKCRKNCG
jgi:F-box/leucine-rich repeat protein 10/11